MITTAIIWLITGLVFGFLIGMYAVFALVYKQITDEFRDEMNERTMELARGLIKLNEAIEAIEGASDAGD